LLLFQSVNHIWLIRIGSRIWLGSNSDIQQAILKSVHDSAIGGHSGVRATYQRLHKNFAWKGMKQAVVDYVDRCVICKQAKHERVKPPGLLQPLAVPPGMWHTVTLDFIEGLPRSAHSNCILVVVDKLSKYAHFVALSHPYTAQQVAMAFVDNIFKLHSLPQVIVSDRDPVFTSKLWQEMFKLVGTELAMSSSRHPQTDGQTERVNQCLETYLCCFVHAKPRQWRQWLPLAEYWYNTSYHTAIQMSPFEALYGHSPRHFGVSAASACQSADLGAWLKERAVTQELLKQHLARARQIMKVQADKHRSDRQFAISDWVFLKVRPYVQSSIADRASHKLAFRFFGPFQVEGRVGMVSYKLKLPPKTLIHPVVHVSLLRQAHPPVQEADVRLPPAVPNDDQDLPPDEPLQVLQRRPYLRGSTVRSQALVQWTSMPESLATWEDEAQLRARFPGAPAWGQAGVEGGDNVKTQTLAKAGGDGAATESSQAGMPGRPQRVRRPNTRLNPAEWDLK
jgi:transposase InsO family protein